jgi:hypothetical protein
MNPRLLLVAIGLTTGACNPSSAPNAADDPKRALGGVMHLSQNEPTQPLGTGPMFLTDVMIAGRAGEIFTSQDNSCKEEFRRLFDWIVPDDQPVSANCSGSRCCRRGPLAPTT